MRMSEKELLDEARRFCDPETGEIIERIPGELMEKLRAAKLARGVPGRPSEHTQSYATWFVFLNGEIRDRVLAEWRSVSATRKRGRRKGTATDTATRSPEANTQSEAGRPTRRGLKGFRERRKDTE